MLKKKKNKTKTIKPELIKDVNDDTNQIKKFIFILAGVAIIAVILYFVTAKYLVKDSFQDSGEESTATVISYDTVNGGNVFNRPYTTYYVLAYDTESTRAGYLGTLASNFNTDGNKVYTMDLAKEINKKYIGETSNKKASVPSELSLTEPTLILIKNGKISKYYDNTDDIIKVLG